LKDLNVMEFDESIDEDTPMGLLRGIKLRIETYSTLFMRLCRYHRTCDTSLKSNTYILFISAAVILKQSKHVVYTESSNCALLVILILIIERIIRVQSCWSN